MEFIKKLEETLVEKKSHVAFKAGDTITVHYKIKEGDKERIQQFQGVVIQRKGSGVTETFTVRKISNSIGVERIVPVHSPFIDKRRVNRYNSLYTYRVRNFTNSEGLRYTRTFSLNYNTLKLLNTLLVTFFNFIMNGNGVTSFKCNM